MAIDKRTLNGVIKKLKNPENRHKPCVEDRWWQEVDEEPGVYAIFRKGKYSSPVYVGESSSLHERLRDLRNPANHTFTRQIKQHELKGGRKTLERIREYVEDKFVVAYTEVQFGRKEIEEHLIDEWNTSKDGKGYDPKRFNKNNPRWERANAAVDEK